MTISTPRLRGERVTVRLPQELIDSLPSGKDLSDRVRNALWQIRDLTSGDGPLAEIDKRLIAIGDRLAGEAQAERSPSSDGKTASDLDGEERLAILTALQALGDDMVRLQRLVVPIYRYIERDQTFGEKRTIEEVEAVQKDLEERNRRLITEPRERLAARLGDAEG